MNPVISVKDLSVIYDIGEPSETKSLDNVSLDILPREYVIIFGPSGCGKSTLLYSIAGLQRPTSGTVTVDQDDISKYKNKKLAWFHRYKIGMVFQSFHLVNTLSVSENICLPKIFSGLNFGKVKAGANELLRRYGILEQANKFPSELSGGQKQRVAVARALINNPEIILADEPVGNLDSKSAHVVMSIFEELNEIDKKTIILVTHDPAHLQYGNKIVYMMDGKITKVEWRKKKKEASVESYIFKEGKIREDLVRAEYIPLDLRQLMKSFKGMTQEQIGKMLVPFKAQQIFYHSFFSMTSDQILSAIKKTEDFLYLRENFEEFFNDLDMPSQQGGAGWDKRIAKKFSSEVKQLIDQANCISFVDKKKSAQDLANFIVARFELVVEEDEKADLAGVILDRLENRIGVEEFQKLIDISKKKKGLGFDRRTAIKIAREVELLLLLRYS